LNRSSTIVAFNCRVVNAAARGYSGTFIKDGETYNMAISVMRYSATGAWKTDVKAPTDVIDKCLREGGRSVAMWGTIESKSCE